MFNAFGHNFKDMTIEKLIEKAREFEKKNERITWKPNDFPEDMSESSTLCELILEGDMEASIGDYIIKGVNGEFYPCKPNIFAKTYEEVTE